MEDIDYSNIIELNLSNKQLNELPDLSKYTNLEILDCYNNNLTSLNNLPTTLKKLNCSHNQLVRLPKIPSGLQILSCHYNKLTKLPITLISCTNLVYVDYKHNPFESSLQQYNFINWM